MPSGCGWPEVTYGFLPGSAAFWFFSVVIAKLGRSDSRFCPTLVFSLHQKLASSQHVSSGHLTLERTPPFNAAACSPGSFLGLWMLQTLLLLLLHALCACRHRVMSGFARRGYMCPVEVGSCYVVLRKGTWHCWKRYQIINKLNTLHPGFFFTCFCILGGKSTVCCFCDWP